MPETPTRTAGTGGICPTCRFCADQKIPHLCIARGDDDAQQLAALSARFPSAVIAPLRAELLVHPARPMPEVGENEVVVLRAVGRTWCNCGCRPAGTATNGEDQPHA